MVPDFTSISVMLVTVIVKLIGDVQSSIWVTGEIDMSGCFSAAKSGSALTINSELMWASFLIQIESAV